MTQTLILRPKQYAPGDGYLAFKPESEHFKLLHGGNIVEIRAVRMTGIEPRQEKRDESARRRAFVINAVETFKPTNVAMFCHGWRTGCQMGFGVDTVDEFADALSKTSETDCPVVTLYSCSCASGFNDKGDKGFADTLRDALCKRGMINCRVDGHTAVGHCTRNPFVRRFEGGGLHEGGNGGEWIVSPKSELWQAWIRYLNTDLRFLYPYVSIEQVHTKLRAHS